MLRTLSLVGFLCLLLLPNSEFGALSSSRSKHTQVKLLSNDAYGTKKYEYYNEAGSWPCQEIDPKRAETHHNNFIYQKEEPIRRSMRSTLQGLWTPA